MIHEQIIYILVQILRFVFKVEFILDGSTAVHTTSAVYDTMITILYLFLSVIVSYLMYKFIEKKI